ncbi:MAG: type II secretion system protein [Patescibacteria group bacterium]
MKTQKGFTLIELLIVIAVIVLIGTMAAVAVSSARSKQRDATRLSNVRQVQSALEDYFNERNSYPAGENLPIGDGAYSACLSTIGFLGNCSGEGEIIMRIVPATFAKGLDSEVTCGAPVRSAFCYTQHSEGLEYYINFELENSLSQVGLQKGVNCATPKGIQAGRCK